MLRPFLACPGTSVPCHACCQGLRSARCGIIHRPVLPVHGCLPHGALHGRWPMGGDTVYRHLDAQGMGHGKRGAQMVSANAAATSWERATEEASCLVSSLVWKVS